MHKQTLLRRVSAFLLSLGLTAACAGSDNPTALADLEVGLEIEVSVAEIQTLEEVEFHLHIEESGMHMDLAEALVEVQHADGGAVREVAVEREGEEYSAHVTFFEPGEHHIHLMGRPRGHGIMGEMGEFEVDVTRRHAVVGPYWVEIETDPHGPLLEGQTAHIHVHLFDLLSDSTRGDPALGLDVVLEVHTPGGVEEALTVTEEEGTYEAEYSFGAAGLYELHVEIDLGTEEVSGEFHIPVFTEHSEDQPTDTGGHGHG
jgi:hypothetical protein